MIHRAFNKRLIQSIISRAQASSSPRSPFSTDVPSIVCRKADLNDVSDAANVVHLLNCYSLDEMGGGEGLSEDVKRALIPSLVAHGKTTAFLAFTKEQKAVGLAICFDTFSSFECKRVLNIHDFVTLSEHRRQGVGTSLLEFISATCKMEVPGTTPYCKITLEVLEGNAPAKKLYAKHGYNIYRLDQAMGGAEFWQCKL